MTIFGLICAALSIVAMVPMLYVLLYRPEALNWSERFGLALLSASTFLSIFKQLGMAHVVAPFDPWYQLVWQLGLNALAGGFAWRFIKHHIGNSRQARILILDARERRDPTRGLSRAPPINK